MSKHGFLWAALLLGVIAFMTGCNGALWGNLLMVSLTIGIFLGTLSLGRRAEAATTSGGASMSNR